MQGYTELSLRENPYHPIIHVGTNDISTNKKPQQIPKSIVELVLPVKSNSCDVTLSWTRVRNTGHNETFKRERVTWRSYAKKIIFFWYNTMRQS